MEHCAKSLEASRPATGKAHGSQLAVGVCDRVGAAEYSDWRCDGAHWPPERADVYWVLSKWRGGEFCCSAVDGFDQEIALCCAIDVRKTQARAPSPHYHRKWHLPASRHSEFLTEPQR